MSEDALLTLFDRVADTVGSVEKLRQIILDLAIRGRLVEQDEGDEPVGSLRDRVSRARFELGKRAKRKTSGTVYEKHKYPIPPGWAWVELGEYVVIEMGQSPKSEFYNQDKDGIPFFQGKADFGKDYPTPRYWCTEPTKYAFPGDILISVRAPVGPTNFCDVDCCIGRGLTALRCLADSDRMFLRLVVQALEGDLANLGFGTTFAAINRQHLEGFIIPLPPLAEQKRIVAKVEDLMGLCDELEAAHAERERQRERLNAASLHRIATAPDDDALRSAARFHFQILPRVTVRPDQIAPLRQTILDLAVRGKLVEQDKGDANSPQTLNVSKLDSESAPFEIPRNWVWTQIGHLAKLINGDRSKKYPNRTEYVPEGVPWINTGHIEPDGTLSRTRMHHITREKFDSLGGGKIQGGDLVYCLRGATIGKTAFVDPLREGAIASSLVIVRFGELVETRFGFLFLISPPGKAAIKDFDNGTAQPNLSAAGVKKYAIPLPPLAEQHRIVAKVDELMSLCDELEASLIRSQTESRRLLDAVMAEIQSAA
ncbi:MAG: restriction endonuclease subunit S [Verrucomicrobiales bacterium]